MRGFLAALAASRWRGRTAPRRSISRPTAGREHRRRPVYEGLAWIAGAIVASGGRAPVTTIALVALLYGLGAHGILTLNDFKAIGGICASACGRSPCSSACNARGRSRAP